MKVLTVQGLCKRYAGFALKSVSFAVEKGSIMGFIGRNGAGKSTTIKALLNFVHPDAGEIAFFGERFAKNELAIKQRIGFVSGGINYYPKKRLAAITAATRCFYPAWDEDAYRRSMRLFKLDDDKTPDQLSDGMKVKYSLALSLCHGAELLILDEPTSGLDPVSRDELLDIFLDLARQGISILFSTHITSDLDKCVDDITYIKEGKIIATSEMGAFLAGYRLAEFESVPEAARENLIGLKREKRGYSALVRTADAARLGLKVQAADLESIMVHMEKE